ncbi:MAG TPA: replication-relaxation family protein [Verrucomicrobiales bacterium]|nr:replication-relaxation family protein [Verrucomicrobiales bacterium]
MSFTRRRLPRFRRDGARIPPLHLTPRDLEILRRVGEHRFLRSSHIRRLVGGSPQRVLRRLQLLYHHGCLERPRAQIEYYGGIGKEIVYGLARKGAALLRGQAEARPRLPIGGAGKGTGRVFLDHALMLADILVAIELACRNRPGVRFLSRESVPLPTSVSHSREPFHWFVNLSTRHRIGVIPDAVFGLEYANADGLTETAWFMVEADRSTMPVLRQSLDQSSYFRKLLAYEATWTQRIHRTRLGLPRFRVLSVTTSAERAASLVQACRELERGHGLFLFTDLASLLAAGDCLTHPWATAGAPDSLMPNGSAEEVSSG